MGPAATPPAGWKIRQIPWLAPGTSVAFTGQDLTVDTAIDTEMTVGATLGGGGQAAVFSINLTEALQGSWSHDDVVLRVSYQDDEYGRDPRRTAIYQHLARLRGADPYSDPLEGLLRLHAVGHLPPPAYLPGQNLWAQVLDRGGIGLQQWIGGNHRDGLGHEGGVAVMLPIMQSLALCHREGIVHRDVKPGNVFVNARCPVPAPAPLAGPRASALFAARLPFMRLGDLGSMTYLSADALARLEAGSAPESVLDDVSAADHDAMTHAFTTNIQSGPFTPPEVWASAAQAEAHPAGDVWQLAVTLYYACTGELPFEGWRSVEWRSERSKYVGATQAGEPNAPSFVRLPERLQYLLRWALAADPLDRPDLASLTDELTQLPGVSEARRSAHGATNHRAGPPQGAQPLDAVPTPTTAEREGAPSDGGRVVAAGSEAPVAVERSRASDTTAGDNDAITAPTRNSPSGPRTKRREPDPQDATTPTGLPVVGRAASTPTTAKADGGQDAGPSWSAPVTASPQGSSRVAERRARHTGLAPVAAVLVVLLVVGLAYMRYRSHSGPDDAARAPGPSPTVSATPLGDAGSIQWNLRGATLGDVLPQLFTGAALSKRRNLGIIQEKSFQFCRECARDSVRLRVDVVPPSGPRLTAGGTPKAQPVGPYLVVMTDSARTDWAEPFAVEPARSYPIPRRYASAKYRYVHLVAINNLSDQNASATPKWQTLVSGSRQVQQLTFDIPERVAYVTVLWFNNDGVVGFNQFDAKHRL